RLVPVQNRQRPAARKCEIRPSRHSGNRASYLRQYILQHMPMHVGQAHVAAAEVVVPAGISPRQDLQMTSINRLSVQTSLRVCQNTPKWSFARGLQIRIKPLLATD